jgi:integrase/recombinase XerD
MIDLSIQIPAFLNYCRNRKALNEKTLRAYAVDLKQFSQFTNYIYGKNEICDYISHHHSLHSKPRCLTVVLSLIRHSK